MNRSSEPKKVMFTIGIERFLSNLGGGLSIGMTLGYWNVAGAMKSPDSESTSDGAGQTGFVPYELRRLLLRHLCQ